MNAELRYWTVFDPRGGFWRRSDNPALIWLTCALPQLEHDDPAFVGEVFDRVAEQADYCEQTIEVAGHA